MNRRAQTASLVLMMALLTACPDSPEDNTPPELSPLPAEVRVRVGETVDLTVTATDPDGDDITLTLNQAPDGAEFISPGGLGRFHWSPIVSDAAGGGQAHEVVFVATDSRGGTDSARVTIEVEASDGAPRFVTGGQTVLDLGQTDTLELEIAVKDDDSARVSLELTEAPKGMELRPTGDKSSLLVWKPSDEQIQTKPVWGAVLVADDGTSGPVTQELSVILISKTGCDERAGCGCQVPRILHDELPEQRGVEDYHVLATIKDDESSIQRATLFWTDGDPEDRANFNAVPMTSESGSDWVAPIPNPLLERGDSRQLFYFICAQDDDDSRGTECDNLACEPMETSWSFTAYAPGDEGCADDRSEPNNSPEAASFLREDTVIEGLTICPGDEDWFSLELEEDEAVDVLMAHTATNGNLDIEVYGSDRATLLSDSTSDNNDEIVTVDTGIPGKYYFRIFGEPNSYDILYEIRARSVDGCTDEFEPNEGLAEATPLEPGDYPGLQLCEDDADTFAVFLEPGDVLRAAVRFSHEEGDLDLFLLDPEGQALLARSISSTDDEEFSFDEVAQEGDYLVQVLGYLGDSAAYDLEIEVTHPELECRDDEFEPNDSASDATHLDPFIESAATICDDDIDVWSFPLDQGQRGRVNIAFDGFASDLDLALFSQTEDGLDLSDGVDSTESVAWTAREDTTLFAAVVAFEQETGGYTISLEVCDNDDSDPNDTADEAGVLEGELDDRVLCLGESDYYLVEVFGGRLNTFVVQTDAPDEVQAELAEGGGRVLLRGQRQPDSVDVAFMAEEDDILLLKVQSNRRSGDPIVYSLTTR